MPSWTTIRRRDRGAIGGPPLNGWRQGRVRVPRENAGRWLHGRWSRLLIIASVIVMIAYQASVVAGQVGAGATLTVLRGTVSMVRSDGGAVAPASRRFMTGGRCGGLSGPAVPWGDRLNHDLDTSEDGCFGRMTGQAPTTGQRSQAR